MWSNAFVDLSSPTDHHITRLVAHEAYPPLVSGTNTRRIRGALEPLLTGAALSKSAVSRLVTRLEESYRVWQQRDLAEEKIVYLYLDAIYPKVRSGGWVISQAVLVALGCGRTAKKCC